MWKKKIQYWPRLVFPSLNREWLHLIRDNLDEYATRIRAESPGNSRVSSRFGIIIHPRIKQLNWKTSGLGVSIFQSVEDYAIQYVKFMQYVYLHFSFTVCVIESSNATYENQLNFNTNLPTSDPVGRWCTESTPHPWIHLFPEGMCNKVYFPAWAELLATDCTHHRVIIWGKDPRFESFTPLPHSETEILAKGPHFCGTGINRKSLYFRHRS
jgi:hypothetical protein